MFPVRLPDNLCPKFFRSLINSPSAISHYRFGSISRHNLPDSSLSRKLASYLAARLNEYHKVNYSNEFWSGLLQPSLQILLEQLSDANDFLSRLSSDEIIRFFDRPLDADNPYLDLEYRDLVRLFVNFCILPNRRMSKVISLCSCRNTPNSRITLSQYIFSVVHAFSSLGRLFRFISRIVFTCKIRFGFFRNIDVVFFQRILSKDAQSSVSSYLSQSGYTSKSIYNINVVSPLNFTSFFKHKHNAFRLQKFSSRIVLGLGPIDSFLEHYILRILPTYAVEHFHYYHSIAKRLSSPHIVCKCPTADEPLLRHIIAQKAHTSQLLITFQHGGGYGVHTSPHLDLEYTYSDIFFPWFKSKSGPAGSIVHPSMNEFVTSDNNTNKYSTDVLIIGTSLKSFFRYNLGLLPGSNYLYINKLKQLILLLLANNISLKYRPYTSNPDYVCESIPSLNVDRSPLHSQIASSRAIIVCKPTTVVEQVLLSNRVPFLFWGDEVCMDRQALQTLQSHPLSSIYSSSPDQMCNMIIDFIHNSTPTLPSLLPSLSYLFGTTIASPESVATNIKMTIQSAH